MPLFSANLGFLWPELPLIARIHAAKRAGFDAVECHWPFDVPAMHLSNALQATGLEMLSLNTRPGDRGANEFGVMALEGREAEAIAHVVEALDYAAAISCERVHVMIGAVPSSERKGAMQRVIELLDISIEEAAKRDIELMIEPMNSKTVPGYLISSYVVAEEINDRLADGIGIILDSFHAEMMGHDPKTVFDAYRPWISHVQFSQAPDRGPPLHDSKLFAFFDHLDEAGWEGFVGAEYKPGGQTEATLGWLERYRTRTA
jgi:2-dehydrotetronate isomerase